MKPTDQMLKIRIVLITAIFSLMGFLLEVGPLSNAYHLTIVGLGCELPSLGFLAYLALAASAAVGLHIMEQEPMRKDKEPNPPEFSTTGVGELAGERTRVRPELHQLRMLLTALLGYVLLKGASNIMISLMYPTSISLDTLVKSFEFGFFYVALGWFVLWQLLRWYALQKRWIRLQDELVGGEVTRVVAVVIMVKLFISLYLLITHPQSSGIHAMLVAMLYLMLIPAAYLLWKARPFNLLSTIIGLLITSGMILILTATLVIFERTWY